MNTSYSTPSFYQLKADLESLSKEAINQRYSLNELKAGMVQTDPTLKIHENCLAWDTLYHWCAMTGNLLKLPSELLTRENLVENLKNGGSPLHVAITSKSFGDFPKELITEETLLSENEFGQNCFHLIFEHCQFQHKEVAEFFTEENMTKRDVFQTTPLFWAAQHDNLHRLPKKTLREKILLHTRKIKSEEEHPIKRFSGKQEIGEYNLLEVLASHNGHKGKLSLHLLPTLEMKTLESIELYYKGGQTPLIHHKIPNVTYDHNLAITSIGSNPPKDLRTEILEWVSQKIENHPDKLPKASKPTFESNGSVLQALQEAFTAVRRFQQMAEGANYCRFQS
jgi:hypothetical protein